MTYTVELYRHEPETRWLHRVVLRRQTRARLIHRAVPHAFSLERHLNAPSVFDFELEPGDRAEFPENFE